MSRLYVIVRTDMGSMNPGRVAAQVCHAGSQAAQVLRDVPSYKEWANESADVHNPGGFGTTIVLNGGSLEGILATLSPMEDKLHCGAIVDPSYPLRDGNYTHVLKDIKTCVWLFLDDDTNTEQLDMMLSAYELYKGHEHFGEDDFHLR
jgi:peptidyl-tRNA hydrolase